MSKREYLAGFIGLDVVAITAFFAILPAVILNLLCVGNAVLQTSTEKQSF